MGQNKRKEEARLLEKIREYKKDFRQAFLKKFEDERQAHLQEGEDFFLGVWVPKDRAEELRRLFRKKERTAAAETLVFIGACFLVNAAVLFVFARIVLP